MNKLMTALCLIFLSLALACSQPGSGNLSIAPVPKNPILIPVGSGVTINGVAISSPYFVMSNLTMTWSDTTNSASILAIQIYSNTGAGGGGSLSSDYSCALAGDQLAAIMPSGNTSISKQPSTSATPTTVVTRQFGCGAVPIPSPAPNSFNIPLTMKVSAAVVDPSGANTGRATATTTITLQ